MVEETQESVSAWAVATFGADISDLRCAIRANLEMAELLSACTEPTIDKAKIAEEAADVAIVLARFIKRCGIEASFQDLGCVLAVPDTGHAFVASAFLAECISFLAPLKSPSGAVSFNARLAMRHLVSLCIHLGGLSLQDAVNRKMSINRARKWRLDGSGFGFHLHEEQAK